MKRVLSIQDLSCVGKCSLTVALPVLSAMGCACSVLPTALLSTHTGFADPYRKSLTPDMDAITRHWQSQNISFDAITVGYLADQAQTETVLRILDRFSCPVIVDPVMGDHGKLYSGLSEDHVEAMKKLCSGWKSRSLRRVQSEKEFVLNWKNCAEMYRVTVIAEWIWLRNFRMRCWAISAKATAVHHLPPILSVCVRNLPLAE